MKQTKLFQAVVSVRQPLERRVLDCLFENRSNVVQLDALLAVRTLRFVGGAVEDGRRRFSGIPE